MTTIFGLDFSHYDQVPDGARVVDEGFEFMTHKAGGDSDDSELGAWWKALKPQRGKLLLGAYWVLRRTDGTMAANAFLARLDSQCPGWRDGPFILQLDCESWQKGAIPAPTKGQIQQCANRLHATMPKLRPIVYAPEWVYGDSLDGLGYPLWASSYVGTPAGPASKMYPGDTSSRWHVYSGQAPEVLQFTSSATAAGQTTCDANAYRGTQAELTALLAPGWKVENMDLTKQNLADIAQAVASKLHADYQNTKSGLYVDLAASEKRIVAALPTLAQVEAAVGGPLAVTQEQLNQAMLNAIKALAAGQ